MRASRAVPHGSRLAASDRSVPAAVPGRAVSARRPGREARPAGLAVLRAVPLAPARQARRRPSLLASAAFHAALAAGLLLAATRALPPEPGQVSVPLVFEPVAAPAPLAAPPAAEAAPSSPPATEAPAVPPAPAPPDASAIPELAPPAPLAQTPDLDDAAPPRPEADEVPVPRLRRPPAARAVPHLPPPRAEPRPSSPAAPARGTPNEDRSPDRTDAAAPSRASPAPAAQASGPTLPARPLAGAAGNVQPAYPERARQRGIEGSVVIRAVVSPDGRTASASVARSSGSDILDQAALAAVRGYRFSPASRGGTAVAGVADLPFTFRLEE